MQRDKKKNKIFYHFDPNGFNINDKGFATEMLAAQDIFWSRGVEQGKMRITVRVFVIDATLPCSLKYADMPGSIFDQSNDIKNNMGSTNEAENFSLMSNAYQESIISNAPDSFRGFLKYIIPQSLVAKDIIRRNLVLNTDEPMSVKNFVLEGLNTISLHNQHALLRQVFLALKEQQCLSDFQEVCGDVEAYNTTVGRYFCNAVSRDYEQSVEVMLEVGLPCLSDDKAR